MRLYDFGIAMIMVMGILFVILASSDISKPKRHYEAHTTHCTVTTDRMQYQSEQHCQQWQSR